MIIFGCPSHLKWRAVNDGRNQRRQPIIVARRLAHDGAHRRLVVIFQAAAQRIHQQLFRDGLKILVAVAVEQRLLQPGGAGKLGAVGQLGRCIDDRADIFDAPLAHPIVILQREAQRIHAAMAGSAHRIGPVLLHLLAHRERLTIMILRLQCRNTGRRRRRRGAQQSLQNPLAALHHRSPIGVRGHRENAALPQQSAAVRVGESHAAELRAVNIGDAVMLRQPLVEKSVVGIQQVHHAAVLAQHAGKNRSVSSRNDRRRASSNSGKTSGSGRARARLRRYSHWPAKLSTSASRTWIGQHALAPGGAPWRECAKPCSARVSSSSSGMLLHRKKESREASSKSLRR